jgi:hypothetical protein
VFAGKVVACRDAFKARVNRLAQVLHVQGRKRGFVPDRIMGFLLRTAFALVVTLLVVAPDKVAAHFDTPRFHAVKAELAAEQPAAKLRIAMAKWLNDSRFTTVAGEPLRVSNEQPELVLGVRNRPRSGAGVFPGTP